MTHVFRCSGLLILFLSGCVNMPTQPSEIRAPYISSSKYEVLDCSQLILEQDKLNLLEKDYLTSHENRISASKGHMLYYGWGSGNGLDTVELVKVRGEKDAVRRAMQNKSCIG